MIQTGPFGSQLHASDYTLVGTPLVMPINLGDNKIIEKGIARVGDWDARRLRRHALREGDIIFSRRGDVGRRSIVRAGQVGWLCGTGCLAARFGSNRTTVNPEYVAHYLGSRPAQVWLQDNAVGGTMPNLNTAILSALPVRLPSRADQDAIVAALEDAQAAIEHIKYLTIKKLAIKWGMVQQLLVGKVRLPGFTSGTWETRPLRGGVSLISGTHVMARDCNTQGVGTPYLTGPADFPNGQIKQTKFTTRPISLCRPRDILITVKGSGSGSMVEADAEYCISRQLMAIRSLEWDSRFLFYSLLYNASQIKAASAGLIPGLSRSDILDQQLPTPPSTAEQSAIAEVLSDIDHQIEGLKCLRVKREAIKHGMMQQLLTGSTRLPVQEDAA
ncbi:restriction endonuclease subunit S [Streptomyces sp. NPDC001507]|uniref:restriction endonuclease subunit S n=1 Tax=Streptomyces sp. NPDC001507 TaxID=3364579 RepID=UPI0036C00F9F